MKYSPDVAALFGILADRPIAYHPALAKILGGVKEAIFLCQLLYWHGKGRDGNGWIYKTIKDWTDETGLSRWEQATARKHLKELGVLKEERRDMPAKLYFKVDLTELKKLIVKYFVENSVENSEFSTDPQDPPAQTGGGSNPHEDRIESSETPDVPQTRMWEHHKQECGNTTNNTLLYTENTTENIVVEDCNVQLEKKRGLEVAAEVFTERFACLPPPNLGEMVSEFGVTEVIEAILRIPRDAKSPGGFLFEMLRGKWKLRKGKSSSKADLNSIAYMLSLQVERGDLSPQEAVKRMNFYLEFLERGGKKRREGT